MYILKVACVGLSLLAGQAAAQDIKCVLCGALFTILGQLSNPDAPDPTANPDNICKDLGMCDGTCLLYANGTWPAPSPVTPGNGGAIDQRRRLAGHMEQKKIFRRHSGKPASPAATKPSSLVEALRSNQVGFEAAAQAAFSPDRIGSFFEAIDSARSAAGGQLDFMSGMASLSKFLAGGAAAIQCNLTDISCDIKRVFDLHLPLIDADNDGVAGGPASFLNTGFRGGDWRGRDCDDSNAAILPSRAEDFTLLPEIDQNCNGISGSDPASGLPWEEQFCSGDNRPMGLIALGDSATAHFAIPPQYFNARSWSWDGVQYLGANEADWPQCSASTGFQNTSSCPTTGGVTIPMNSLYQRMRSLNQCNHRHFINNGVNGARSGSMTPGINNTGIVNAIGGTINQTHSVPQLVMYALIGNDVCSGHPTFDTMTTPAEFQANVLLALSYLDTVLPAGSHVTFMPLANGSVLYDTTHARLHPLGVTYSVFYDYLACNGATPCWGWMNSNETVRDTTTAIAASLSSVYDSIISNHTYRNFDLHKLNIDWSSLFSDYAAAGGDPFDLIEHVDGFHPSQSAQQLLAGVVWQDLATNKPTWLPTANPNNAQIQAIFGDQGGY